MAAEGLPVAGAAGGPPSWELEAWYQDLQEVLAAAEPAGPPARWGSEQAAGRVPAGCELDAALTTELLELLGPDSTAGTESERLLHPTSCRSSPTPVGEEGQALERRAKRKRCSGGAATRELANEQRVLQLTAHNERLREEIQQLSAEVEKTRAALIERMVNLHRT
ncbi:DDIT3 protein, partial [Penelope pileata]|nr:DDIT3 protein [Penelope pileata]